MSIFTRAMDAVQLIGADIKSSFTNQGQLTDLQTTAKQNLVAAINEAVNAANQTEINDGVVSTSSTYSSAKISAVLTDAVAQAKADVLGGIPPGALDTIKELADALLNDQNLAASLLTALNTKVSFTEAQSLTEAQKVTARGNIGAAAASDLTALQSSTSANFDSVNTAMTNVDARLSTTETGLATAQSNISTVTTGLATANTAISNLQTGAAATAASITNLQGQVTTNKQDSEARDTVLTNSISSLDASVTTRVAAAKAEVQAEIGADIDLVAVYMAAKSPF
jgi:hypothetical protein